jgi:hypothetical protein
MGLDPDLPRAPGLQRVHVQHGGPCVEYGRLSRCLDRILVHIDASIGVGHPEEEKGRVAAIRATPARAEKLK